MKKPLISLTVKDKKLLKSSKVRKWIKETEDFLNNHPNTRAEIKKVIDDEFEKEMNLLFFGNHIEKK